MRAAKRPRASAATIEAPKRRLLSPAARRFLLLFASALIVAFYVYGPSLAGPFVFDDLSFPFALKSTASRPFFAWVNGVRPVLYFSFWLNHALIGDAPAGFHVVNVLIHAVSAGLVFFVVLRILGLCAVEERRRRLLAGAAAGVFLLHPIQTESVAYVAGRSESLSAMFALAAWAVFLYRSSQAISWGRAAAVLVLFGCACATKEHAVALVPVLLLTDYFFNPGFSLEGIRRNWRLYVPLAAGAALAGVVAWHVIAGAGSAGFEMKNVTWYQYFFTECRMFFIYLRLFFVPVGQTVDYDVPISTTIFQHGSLMALIVIICMVGAAFALRRRFPIASFGFLTFLVLLAPTSSFVPIRDPIVEHRMYLPMLGLILVVVEPARRLRLSQQTLIWATSAVLLLSCVLTYRRSQVWSSPTLVWQDAIAKAPAKARPYENLASVYLREGRCQQAASLLRSVAGRVATGQYFLITWGAAEQCLARYDEAGALLEKAVAIQPDAHAYVLLGSVRQKQGKVKESLEAFEKAIQLDPNSDVNYLYRGEWYQSADQFDAAVRDFRRALEINPNNAMARRFLAEAENRIRQQRGASP